MTSARPTTDYHLTSLFHFLLTQSNTTMNMRTLSCLAFFAAILALCGSATNAFVAPYQSAVHSVSSTLYMAEESFETTVTLPGKDQLTAQMKFPRVLDEVNNIIFYRVFVNITP